MTGTYLLELPSFLFCKNRTYNNNLREGWRLSEVSSEKLWHLALSPSFKILSRKDSTTWVKVQCHLCTLLLQSMQLLLLLFSHIWPFATQWTAAHQAPLSMEFSRQEHWNGLPFPPLGDIPYRGIKPVSPPLAGRFFTEPPGKPY